MFKTIKCKLITAFIVIISICLVAMALIMSNIIENTMRDEFITSTENEMNKVEEIVHTFFNEMMYNGKSLSEMPAIKNGDNTITSYVNAVEPNGKIKLMPLENGEIERNIYYIYENFVTTHPNVGDVCFATTGGSYVQYAEGFVKNNYDPRNRDWYKLAMKNPNKVSITNAYYWSSADVVNVGIVKAVRGYDGNIIGAQSIEVPLSGLTDILSKLKIGENGYVILLEDTGKILSHPAKPEMNFKNIKDTKLKELSNKKNSSKEFKDNGVEYITNAHTSKENGWTYISVVPKNELTQKTRVINISIIVLGIIILLISVVVSMLISKGISNPIQIIRDLMKHVENGNFNVKSSISGQDELAELSDSFNNMTEHVRSLIESSKQISYNITDSADTLAEMSNQVSFSAEEITNAISALAAETYQQTRQTDGIVNSIEQITKEIEISSNIIKERTKSALHSVRDEIEIMNSFEIQTENERIVIEFKETLKKIVNIIEDITKETVMINKSLEKMDYEKEQTSDAIYRISYSSEQAAVTSEEITASSEEQTESIYKMTESIKSLRDMSNELKSSISKFNI